LLDPSGRVAAGFNCVAHAMSDRTVYEVVERAPGVRIRQETEATFLLYHPVTDELHLVGREAKVIFELCDGRAIDDVVREGARLLDQADEAAAEAEVLAFLTSLHRRSLVRFA
jgi:hypothetical protein